ncbi:chemotaxis protein CheB [Luteimonas sp. SDU82]|uniref:chemotaxis protein CheB n=1 Tax=Luteimonas sp. SDU82 TaxID=3422592 RepID=UPI003EC12AE9
MAASEAAPRVALLARAGEACERIADALREAGAEVVLVADPMQAEPQQVRQAQPQAVLVALEPAIEDAIERFEDVLADPAYMVIFEEAEQAAQRTGWDAARWMRHLSAKLHRHHDVLPAGAGAGDELELTAEPMRAPLALMDFDDAIVSLRDEAQGRADAVPQDGLEGLLASPDVEDPVAAGADWLQEQALPAFDPSPSVPHAGDPGAPESGLEGVEGTGPNESQEVPSGMAVDWQADAAGSSPGSGDDIEPEQAFSTFTLSLDDGQAGELEELSFDPERFSRAHQAEDAPAGIEEFLAAQAAAAKPGHDAPGDSAEPLIDSAAPPPSQTRDDEAGGAPARLDFSALSLVDDDHLPVAPVAAAKVAPSFDLDALGAGLSLVDPDSYGNGKTPGLVLIEAGLGGPDAVRQLLAALPAGFPRAILIRLQLEGGRYDRLVKQMTRATSVPVSVAEAGEQAAAGSIHFVPPGLGLRAASSGWVFDAAEPLDPAGLPADDSAVLFLSGADTALVPSLAGGGWGGLVLGQTPDEGCYDPAAARAAIEAGAAHGSPSELAAALLARWPAPVGRPPTDPNGMP